VVKTLNEEDINSLWNKLVNNFKENWYESSWDKRWEVVSWSIEPTNKESVISKWKAFRLVKELKSSVIVEFGSVSFSQRKDGDVEVSILSILDPIIELVLLDVMDWPVPSIL